MTGDSNTADALLAAMSEAVYVVDRQRRITYWNPAAEHLTGFPAAEVLGRHCRDGILNHVDDTGAPLCGARCPLLATMRDGNPSEAFVFLHHRDGHRVAVAVRGAALRNSDGRITGAVEVFHDDSRYRAAQSEADEAQQLALTDPLTRLGNRRMLQHALESRRDESRRYGRRYAVLFADIDHFKNVNDSYGHDTGDQVLQLVAATLRDCTRISDTVGRWGGEEFLYLAPVADEIQAIALAERTRHLVHASWLPGPERPITVTLSIGIALANPDETSTHVVDRADAAMLNAKQQGRNRSHVGTPSPTTSPSY